MAEEFIVKRRVAPNWAGWEQHYVKTSNPVPGETVYSGDFKPRSVTWGLNEPVIALIWEPTGEIQSETYNTPEKRNL